MNYQKAILALALLVAATLTAVPYLEAQKHGPDDDPETVLREVVVHIDPATTKRWKSAKEGVEIAIPWFDDREVAARVDRIETHGETRSVVATIPDDIGGDAVLTFGDDGLFGAMDVGTDSFRLRQLNEDAFLLTEVNGRGYEHGDLDTDESDETRPPRRRRRFIPAAVAARLRPDRLIRILNREVLEDPVFKPIPDDGSRIDILVGYTTEAREWAESNGYPILSAITGMVVTTNVSFAYSGVETQLRLVGTQEVDHTVVDEAKMELDLVLLRGGVDDLDALHRRRDEVGADLVTLLVLNGGADACGVDSGRACGRAMVPRRYPRSGEEPRSDSWDDYYDIMGFSIMHLPAAINYHTFKHEVAHNLGAHHDALTFAQDGTNPTVEDFSRGWVLWEHKLRTVMSYDRLCEFNDEVCPIVPRFSNPNRLWQNLPEAWLGDPPPGRTRRFLGPADNVTAMNKMKLTVANYRATRIPQ